MDRIFMGLKKWSLENDVAFANMKIEKNSKEC